MEEKLTHFVSQIRRRNIRETVVALFLVAFVGYPKLRRPHFDLEMAGYLILVAASLFIVLIIWLVLHIPSADLRAFPPARFPDKWRAHLTRQARMLRLAWLWYALPIFIGLSVVAWGGEGRRWLEIAIFAVVFGGIAALNFFAARQVERDRDAWFGAEKPA